MDTIESPSVHVCNDGYKSWLPDEWGDLGPARACIIVVSYFIASTLSQHRGSYIHRTWTLHRYPCLFQCFVLHRYLIQVDYTDLGGMQQVQIWDIRGPQFIRNDWRPGERFLASLNVPKAKHNTLEKMLFNVGLITPFAKECTKWFNQRLDSKGETDWTRPRVATRRRDEKRPRGSKGALHACGRIACMRPHCMHAAAMVTQQLVGVGNDQRVYWKRLHVA